MPYSTFDIRPQTTQRQNIEMSSCIFSRYAGNGIEAFRYRMAIDL